MVTPTEHRVLQAAYYALFKLGRFGFYLLVPGHTNAYSLLTNALLMCRFAPPLAFNFMAALAMPASKHDERHDVTETVSHCHALSLPALSQLSLHTATAQSRASASTGMQSYRW